MQLAALLVAAILLVTTSSHAAPASSPTTMTLFIGSYTDNQGSGIAVTQFNSETGEIAVPRPAVASPNASFLAVHPNGTHLFAANESGEFAGQKGGGVSVFGIGAGQKLTPLATASLPGGPCHIAIDAGGKLIAAVTYGAGTTAAYAMPTGDEALQRVFFAQHVGSGPDPHRQKAPHAHQAVFSPDNRFLFVADLGTDQLVAYRIGADGVSLAPEPAANATLPPGSGPRHLVFTPDAKYLYVVNEMGNTITGFHYDAATGRSEVIETVPTLPADFKDNNSTAEIAIHPDGRFLYASNRGHDSIARFEILADGKLKPLGHTPTGGKHPRHFTFDPSGSWLLVANADSRSITVFGVARQNGDLDQKSVRDGLEGKPVCLLFVPAK